MDEKIYKLKLHECTNPKDTFGIVIMRVPGGWLYDCWDVEKDCFKQGGYFVPYNNDMARVSRFP